MNHETLPLILDMMALSAIAAWAIWGLFQTARHR